MPAAPMRLAILGSTGSIGHSALAVVDAHPNRLQVIGLAAGTAAAALALQVERYRQRAVVMATDAARDALRAALPTGAASHLDLCGAGPEALIALVTRDDVDTVLCASSGTAALEAVVAAIKAGKRIALANKEVLVMAGRLVMDLARAYGIDVLPVDSEHNAIHQCLHRRDRSEVRRLILTASGGPFRHLTAEALANVTVDAALSHPTWRMGRKITIDSATLMNKGLEVIEAHWLFGTPASAIDVVVHPQSVVHSLVELTAGSSSRPPTTTGSPACGWPTRPSRPATPIRWCSTRPTRWPWRLSSRAPSHFRPLPRPSTRPSPTPRAAVCSGPKPWPPSGNSM